MKKLKKVLPIILITVILAAMLSINAFAAEELTGYYCVYNYDGNYEDYLTAYRTNVLVVFGALQADFVDPDNFHEAISYLDVGGDIYYKFISESYENDFYVGIFENDLGDRYTLEIDYDLEETVSDDVKIYVTSSAYDYLIVAWDDLYYIPGSVIVGSSDDSFSITTLLDVFIKIPAFIVTAFASLISIFYVGGSLTILGVLAVAALAFATILIIWSLIRRFLSFRG